MAEQKQRPLPEKGSKEFEERRTRYNDPAGITVAKMDPAEAAAIKDYIAKLNAYNGKK